MAYGFARPRVLLIDRRGCALLFCAAGSDGQPFWFTPGGGAKPDETPQAAVLRELEEETGLRHAELEREIWWRTLHIPFDGELREIHQRWFLVRTDSFVLCTSDFDQLEFDTMIEHRWWTASELRATSDRIVPADLGARLADLLCGGSPAILVDISTGHVRLRCPEFHWVELHARLALGWPWALAERLPIQLPSFSI